MIIPKPPIVLSQAGCVLIFLAEGLKILNDPSNASPETLCLFGVSLLFILVLQILHGMDIKLSKHTMALRWFADHVYEKPRNPLMYTEVDDLLITLLSESEENK